MFDPFAVPDPPAPGTLGAAVREATRIYLTAEQASFLAKGARLRAGWAGREPPLKHRQRRLVPVLYGPELPAWTVACALERGA